MLAALLVPLMVGASLAAADYATVVNLDTKLQRIADTTALSTAQQSAFITAGNENHKRSPGDNNKTLTAIAENRARSLMELGEDKLAVRAKETGERLITVYLEQKIDTILGGITGFGKRTLHAKASAKIFKGQKICVIALNNSATGIGAYDSASIDAQDCGIYSNSTDPESIVLEASAEIDSAFVCSSGGFEGSESSVSSPVVTDCKALEDPLKDRAPPRFEQNCLMNSAVIEGDQVEDLYPGLYCGGLTIRENANVVMQPGTYVFQGGPLIVTEDAKLRGTGVGLYFTDPLARFAFDGNADIVLSAPTTGPMAGLLMSAEQNCLAGICVVRTFEIRSPNVSSLLGTIYLPKESLLVDTTMPVSEEAAFTIVVARELDLKQYSSLVLNTDYAATDVPVPEGFVGQPQVNLTD